MKTFLLNIIPKIQKYSKKLDDISVLTGKNWVVIEEENENKIVFIFREKNNQLLISENGKIEKGSWEYLGNKSLLIDRKDGSYLFKHGFIDDTVLALKVDGKNEYALLVNESKFDNQLNSLSSILKFLKKEYSEENQKQTITIPQETKQQYKKLKSTIIVDSKTHFKPSDYPDLVIDIYKINKVLEEIDNSHSHEIIISFCRDHSIKSIFTNKNPELSKFVVSKKLPIELIEQLFKLNKSNSEFIRGFEKYLTKKVSDNTNLS